MKKQFIFVFCGLLATTALASGCARRPADVSSAVISSSVVSSAAPAFAEEKPTPAPTPSPTPSPSPSPALSERAQVRIPAEILEVIPIEKIERAGQILGVRDYCMNIDGSATFILRRSLLRNISSTYASAVQAYVSSMKAGKNWPSLVQCTLHPSMQGATMTVREKTFTRSEAEQLCRALYAPLCLYRLMNEQNYDDFCLRMEIVNESGSIIGTVYKGK